MLQHYLIIAIRNFFKYKLQTVISITGLAIGLVCFAYGINWLKYETSYDSFYPQSKQIYMLYGVDKQTGKKTDQLYQSANQPDLYTNQRNETAQRYRSL